MKINIDNIIQLIQLLGFLFRYNPVEINIEKKSKKKKKIQIYTLSIFSV